MKLKKIKTFIFGNPPPHFGGKYWIFIKLITDKDIIVYGYFYSEILNEPIKWGYDFIIPSTKNGLGVEINENIANKYKYNGEKLHLEMAEI